MTGERQLRIFTETSYSKTITKVGNHIYHFLGFRHSNAIAIEANTSVILIDTPDSDTRGLHAIESVLLQTLDCMNQGMTLS